MPVVTPELDSVPLDFVDADGSDLMQRWSRHQAFWDCRLAAGLDPSARVLLDRPGPEVSALTRGQEQIRGINFTSHDHLSLASHPQVRAAAVEAIAQWGVHSAGPAIAQGATRPVMLLEERLAELLCCREATVFPTGWAAGYGAIRTLVREGDHILLDALAHSSFQEAAVGVTGNVHRMPHCSHDAVAERLVRLRADNANAGILVVTESLFRIDAAVPNLRAMRDACRVHGATLLVCTMHDLGAVGDGGLGFLGEQAMVGEVDLVVGSFSRSFASNGGFVASSMLGLKHALRVFASPLATSSALSPVQAVVVLTALDIIGSAEGAKRRRRLAANVARLREGFAARAFRVLGQPGPIVPVLVGSIPDGRRITRATLERGALVELAEHPAVSRVASRWLLNVMTDHTDEHLDQLVSAAVAARELVQKQVHQGGIRDEPISDSTPNRSSLRNGS